MMTKCSCSIFFPFIFIPRKSRIHVGVVDCLRNKKGKIYLARWNKIIKVVWVNFKFMLCILIVCAPQQQTARTFPAIFFRIIFIFKERDMRAKWNVYLLVEQQQHRYNSSYMRTFWISSGQFVKYTKFLSVSFKFRPSLMRYKSKKVLDRQNKFQEYV